MNAGDSTQLELANDTTVRLMTKISSTVVAAPNKEAFAKSLADALQQHLAVAVSVYLRDSSPSPLAVTGDPEIVAETNMLLVGERMLAEAAPGVSSRPVAQGDDRVWIIAPLKSSTSDLGVVLMLSEHQDATTKLQTMQCVRVATELATRFFDKRVATSGSPPFANLHDSLDLKQTSHTVSNELRRALDCDRVSVFLRSGSRYRLASVSGQAAFNRRANVVRVLRHLVQRVAKFGESFYHPSDSETPPQIEATLQPYLDESDVKSVCIVPLRRPENKAIDGQPSKPGPIFAALALENFRAQVALPEKIESSPIVLDATCSLHNAQRHSQIFLLPLWRSLGRGLGANPLMKCLAALVLIGAAIAGLGLVKTDYYVHADGTIQPKGRRRVFAPSDGIVGEIFVKHAQLVEKGDVLFRMDNAELEQRFEQLSGELQIASEKLATINTLRLRAATPGRQTEQDTTAKAQLSAEKRQLESQVEHLAEQCDLLKKQIDRLDVSAPISGEVVTWDLQGSLRSRPVNRGELLVTLADVEGSWQLELDLPESRIQTLLDSREANDGSLPVQFVAGTGATDFHEATLASVADSAQLDDKLGLSVKLLADVPDDLQFERRVGADVRAKIPCGKRSWGYVLFNDIAEFVRMRWMFYFG